MTDNKTIILNKFEKHKGEFVITNEWNVQRLVAIAQDDRDYYYVMYNGRQFTFFTCVGKFIPLKGKIDDKHYQEFIRLAKLNHFDQINQAMFEDKFNEKEITETEFNLFKLKIQEHKTNLINLQHPDEFLTEVCWDLN